MSFWQIAGCITAVKVLLVPSYHSTDFEVHRNWLAITHSLPISKWYYEETSEWTLDYPPLFALFEYLLSQIAQFLDKKMLDVRNLNYASEATVLFQRGSVIATDLLYMYAVKEYCSYCLGREKKTSTIFNTPKFTLAVLLICNFGLLLVDHIHFQYNGFLFGIMLLSITRICQGHVIEGALWFAVALNFKHIFLYIAPAYFVFLLRSYCFSNNKDGNVRWASFSVRRFCSLGIVVSMVFILSFGPYIILHQIPQVLSRLFPFKRGLCHAYWAANFWALYNIADKVAAVVGVRMGLLSPEVVQQASMTSGLVQQYDHAVLPSITPVITLACTVTSMMPYLVHMWRYPTGPRGFLRGIVLCAFSSFMFGWHVHEKAVLLIILPLTLLAMMRKADAQVFLLVSTTGHLALFPLIFTPAETPIKYGMMLFFTIFSFSQLGDLFNDHGSWYRLPILNTIESVYIVGLVAVEVYCSLIHWLLGLQDRLPFLPLLLMSTYCAVGISYSWLKFYRTCLLDRTVRIVKQD
ncbi:putative dolichyl pyrophosphate Glc1Man9GlcNAc2 alpha-1,3-glucosyltransferase [Lamellibrachia satsuma]|nr:putative dolichyl pyrophosphate Glc1Man9GlcNAc2 alpha-1,3-glucosyltransferase [Lamellibrachia satsuma]